MSDAEPLTAKQRESALALLKEARSVFFKLAEQSIRVPLDVPGDLRAKAIDMRMSERLYFANQRLKDIKQLCEQTKEQEGIDANGAPIWKYDKLACAKLAGAYVNKMGVLAEEALQAGSYYRSQKPPPGAARMPEDDIGSLYLLARKLLHNVRLHNGKGDLDKVLEGQLGEVFKACTGIERAQSAESFRVKASVEQMSTLVDWMKRIVSRHASAYPPNVIQLLDELRADVERRLTMPVDTSYAHLNVKDASDVNIRHRSSRLREYVHRAAIDNAAISGDAHNLERGSRLIEEMVDQIEKPLSLRIVMGIELMEQYAETLTKSPQGRDAETAIHRLMSAERRHMSALLAQGKPAPLFQDNFERAYAKAKAAAAQVPESLQRQYLEGIDTLYAMAPDIGAHMQHDTDTLCKTMAEVARKIAGAGRGPG